MKIEGFSVVKLGDNWWIELTTIVMCAGNKDDFNWQICWYIMGMNCISWDIRRASPNKPLLRQPWAPWLNCYCSYCSCRAHGFRMLHTWRTYWSRRPNDSLWRLVFLDRPDEVVSSGSCCQWCKVASPLHHFTPTDAYRYLQICPIQLQQVGQHRLFLPHSCNWGKPVNMKSKYLAVYSLRIINIANIQGHLLRFESHPAVQIMTEGMT